VWHWSGVAEALRVLAILLEHRTPLGEALRLAGQGASDAHVGRVLCGIAAQIEAGASFPDSVDEDGRLPRSLVPVLRAGERSGALAQGARDGAIMLEKRVAAQGDLIAAIVPPLLLLFVAMALMSAITAIMLPMMSLLRGLSL
jgi:type II secretory pathway component PulF